MKRYILLAAVFLFPIGSTGCQTIADKAASDDVVIMADEDPAMRKAFQKAGSTLDDFVRVADSKNANLTDFAVKVGIKEDLDTEYFWIVNFKEENEAFSGEIANEPRMVKRVRAGDIYKFKKSDIVDWTYTDISNNRMHGNFTLCALLTKEPQEESMQMRERLKLDCSFLVN